MPIHWVSFAANSNQPVILHYLKPRYSLYLLLKSIIGNILILKHFNVSKQYLGFNPKLTNVRA